MTTNPNPLPTPTSLVPPNLDDDADLQALLDLLADDNTADVLAEARAITTLDWEDGDILAVGSSATHPVARVFLGSSAAKIIRYAPVPVVAVPGAGTPG